MPDKIFPQKRYILARFMAERDDGCTTIKTDILSLDCYYDEYRNGNFITTEFKLYKLSAKFLANLDAENGREKGLCDTRVGREEEREIEAAGYTPAGWENGV